MSCNIETPYEGLSECEPIRRPEIKLTIRTHGAAFDQFGNFVGKVEKIGKKHFIFNKHGGGEITLAEDTGNDITVWD